MVVFLSLNIYPKQIERKLSTAVQSQTTPQGKPDRPVYLHLHLLTPVPSPFCTCLVISSTLQTQHGIFVSLAGKTAAVDAELQKVKALYTQLWRAKTGSMRDPFNDLDRGSGGDFGMESLRVT